MDAKRVDLWKEHHPTTSLCSTFRRLDGVGTLKEIRGEDEKARIIVLTHFRR